MRNWKKLAALGIAGTMLVGGASFGVFASTEDEKPEVSLSLTDNSVSVEAEETEAETEEKTTEAPAKTFDQLETTGSTAEAIHATDVSDIVKNSMPSIVAITTTQMEKVESYFYGTQEYEVQGGGSGIIVAQNDTELLIATNNHVVEGASELTVCFTADSEDPDKLLAKAVVKGTSPSTDLAVIAVNLEDIDPDIFPQLKVATLGTSADLMVGEPSIVIGNALGEGQSVSVGIISALGKKITTEAGTFTELQTDAAVNLGCSGGAILNKNGEVIGITDAKSTSYYADDMGYGIPIDTAIPILHNLINRETRDIVEDHGYLGVTVVPVSEEAMMMYDMPAGAFVFEVGEGSAAEEAGIEKGNIITKLDGMEVNSSDALVNLIQYYGAGETVTVELQVSEGSKYVTKEVEVTLQGASEGTDVAPEKKEEESEEEKETNSDKEEVVPENEQGAPEMEEYPNDEYGFFDFFGEGNPYEQFFGNGEGRF